MIGLAAAAMVTYRIRLGTMITPAPLRIPGSWRVNLLRWIIYPMGALYWDWEPARSGWAGRRSPMK